MNNHLSVQHKIRNIGQTFILIAGMCMLLALSGRLLFGPDLWIVIFISIIFLMLTLPSIPPYWLLKMYHARPVRAQQSTQLVSLLNQISATAGLPRAPELFWIPSQTLNAFAVGSREHSAIAITDGLLRVLSERELKGVLAHEISHIRNNDLRIMTLADIITRITHTLSLTAILITLFTLPFVLLGQISISLGGLIILVFMPTLSALMQLGLSRVREFEADLDAARITQDPLALASALNKLDYAQTGLWQRVFFPGYRHTQPSILRTHPATAERVDSLVKLHQQEPGVSATAKHALNRNPIRNPYAGVITRKPRHGIFTGSWH